MIEEKLDNLAHKVELLSVTMTRLCLFLEGEGSKFPPEEKEATPPKTQFVTNPAPVEPKEAEVVEEVEEPEEEETEMTPAEYLKESEKLLMKLIKVDRKKAKEIIKVIGEAERLSLISEENLPKVFEAFTVELENAG